MQPEFGDSRLPKKFWDKCGIDSATECWSWTASKVRGYGQFHLSGGNVLAHRHAYESLVAQVPRVMTCDHLCRNRACCNPSHIDIVTNKENVLRGESFSAKNARKTHCILGHPLSGDNLLLNVRKSGSTDRVCRTCKNVTARNGYHRRKDSGHV